MVSVECPGVSWRLADPICRSRLRGRDHGGSGHALRPQVGGWGVTSTWASGGRGGEEHDVHVKTGGQRVGPPAR